MLLTHPSACAATCHKDRVSAQLHLHPVHLPQMKQSTCSKCLDLRTSSSSFPNLPAIVWAALLVCLDERVILSTMSSSFLDEGSPVSSTEGCSGAGRHPVCKARELPGLLACIVLRPSYPKLLPFVSFLLIS